MKSSRIHTLTDSFEAHAHQTESSIEFWLARDIQHLLGYSEWRNFTAVVTKAKTACEVSEHAVSDHFVGVNKIVDLLKAKDFATEITIFNSREHQLDSEPAISQEHVTNNAAVRNTLLERGIRPEALKKRQVVDKHFDLYTSPYIRPMAVSPPHRPRGCAEPLGLFFFWARENRSGLED